MWGTTTVIPGAATLFFVNADGWALTCKHVASQLPFADQLLQKFNAFKAERAQLPTGKKLRHALRALERKYGYSNGKFLCRLGFPFPEFTNFEYDSATDQIRWTSTGRLDTPRFPIEGMVTRHLVGPAGVIGFELSTPGLRGQSGGPAFDSQGRVWGMQAATNHLDLDFDVDIDVLRNGQTRRVKDSAFLHVGHCIHVDILKQFMRDHGVIFGEAA